VTTLPQVSASGPAGASARAELGLEDDFYSTSAGQREKALASTDRLNKTGDRIQHGRQQLLETEVRNVAFQIEKLHLSIRYSLLSVNYAC